jgi:hypothetical protein
VVVVVGGRVVVVVVGGRVVVVGGRVVVVVVVVVGAAAAARAGGVNDAAGVEFAARQVVGMGHVVGAAEAVPVPAAARAMTAKVAKHRGRAANANRSEGMLSVLRRNPR